jgi:hypothetical protein
MTDPITRPAYRYGFLIRAIYDADTILGDLDMFDHVWKANEKIRLYGINAQEIKRSKSKGIDADDVEVGYDHRDEFIHLLGLDPADYPRRVRYHELKTPVWVIIETIKDDSGKFGRLLGIIHKDGVNLNEAMRDVIGGVEFYDGKTYPPDYPINPPLT